MTSNMKSKISLMILQRDAISKRIDEGKYFSTYLIIWSRYTAGFSSFQNSYFFYIYLIDRVVDIPFVLCPFHSDTSKKKAMLDTNFVNYWRVGRSDMLRPTQSQSLGKSGSDGQETQVDCGRPQSWRHTILHPTSYMNAAFLTLLGEVDKNPCSWSLSPHDWVCTEGLGRDAELQIRRRRCGGDGIQLGVNTK